MLRRCPCICETGCARPKSGVQYAMLDDLRLARIRSKLSQAQKRELRCFGSETHHFELRPPLSEETIATFERERGLRLPDDYRAFLAGVGNGGAGPFYGLLSLAEWEDAHESGIVEGGLTLCHQGCGYYCVLVTAGPERGRVEYIGNGPAFLVDDLSFLDWYERWLDELLAGYDLDRFGYDMAGDSARLLDVLETADEGDERALAAASLCRLPSLSEADQGRLIAALGDSEATVRERVAWVLGHLALPEAAAALTVCTADVEAPVRREALVALARLKHVDIQPLAAAMLGDPEPGVVEQAVEIVVSCGGVECPEVAALATADAPSLRALLAYLLADTQVAFAEPLIAQLLADGDPDVRCCAVQTAGSLNLSALAPALVGMLDATTDGVEASNLTDAIAAMRHPAVLPCLLRGARHADAMRRYESAQALGTHGDLRAEPALRGLLDDDTWPERRDEQTGAVECSTVWSVGQVARIALRSLALARDRSAGDPTLFDLFGRSHRDPEVATVLSALCASATFEPADDDEDAEYWWSQRHGLQLCACAETGEIQEVVLRQPGAGGEPWSGLLPFGITRTSSRADLEGLLGPPDEDEDEGEDEGEDEDEHGSVQWSLGGCHALRVTWEPDGLIEQLELE